MTVQAQILRLLKDLQRRLNMAMVLITHDMGVVAGAADNIVVMYAARAAERGPVDKVLVTPRHPYTRGLINAIPKREDPIGSQFRGLPGIPPTLGAPFKGCAFAPRCDFAVPTCTASRPPLVPSADGSVFVACPVVNEGKAAA
ncbi:oligopeptide/dipeptide ABC transporter ATP-binding protein [Aminobacter niigataensis]|uniref:Oligopeptide/dipeptide ABC transporter ATP-binding protein n=2 Tax=Aminobacter niigataensis TaxID=83265 RepID=A0ABR6L9U8_9HYPH|nr:oligopeptide/dipeptide ABC transporter ATP-binding protein [Aminobacter niigataensis]